MLEIGVVDLGLSPDEFWDLSWYEWGLYILREKKRGEAANYKFETGWDQTRILWATLRNVHGDKAKPSDLIKLSYDDKVKKEVVRKSPEEVAKKFGIKGK